jgi:hypothetical protein
MERTARSGFLVPGLAAALFLWPAALPASEITIEHTAIEKALMEQVYVDRGRFHVMPEAPCQYAYLSSPAVSIAQGRVRLKTRLTGMFGTEVGSQCSGLSDAFDVTVSAEPYFSGESLGLRDVRVEEAGNPVYKPLLQALMTQTVAPALAINLREGLQRMLADARSPYDTVIEQLTVSELKAENNRISARLSFSLMAR